VTQEKIMIDTPRIGLRRIVPILLLVLAAWACPSTTLWAQPANAQEAVDLYGSAWGEPDEAKRRAILEKAWAEDGVYTDPTAYVAGREALVQHIGGFQAGRSSGSGPSIQVDSSVDVHHDKFLRFAWKMVAADGKTVLSPGMDYGELDEDGRLKLIVGFFGPFPAIAESPHPHAALIGEWNLSGDSPYGTLEHILVVEDDGSATYASSGQVSEVRNLEIDGNEVAFEMTVFGGPNAYEMSFAGRVDENGLEGELHGSTGNFATVRAARE